MNPEQLEFSISQYLDGAMPSGERAAFEQRLAADAEARKLLEEYRSLDGVLKGAMPLPEVRWERLAERIAAAVADQRVSPARRVESAQDESLELAIMQHVDGDLDYQELAPLEQRLAAEPSAQKLLAQHRSLDVLLKNAMPVPHVDYDRLAGHISAAVDAADEAQASRWKISSWTGAGLRVAAAACLLLALGTVIHLLGPGDPGTSPAGPSIAQVNVLVSDELAAGPAILDIETGPSTVARTRLDRYAADRLVAHSARVQLVASAPSSDGGYFPY